MKFLLIFTFLYSPVFASFCYITDDQVEEWNRKYRDRIKIEVTSDDEGFDVIVQVPEMLEKLEFNSVSLSFGDLKLPKFLVPLSTFEEEGETKVWYFVSEIPTEQHFLNFGYGEGCGISVNLPVEFRQQIIE